MSVAGQVVLAFASRGLEESAKLAGRVERALERAKADLNRVTQDADALGDGRDEDPRVRRQQAGKRLEKRGRRARRRIFQGAAGGGVIGRDAFGAEAIGQLVGGGPEAAIGGVVARFATQNPLLAGVAGGAISALGGVVIERFVRPFVESQLKAIERARLDPILARLDRIEADSFQRKLQEDSQLQARVNRAEIDRNNALAAGQWVKDRGPLGRFD